MTRHKLREGVLNTDLSSTIDPRPFAFINCLRLATACIDSVDLAAAFWLLGFEGLDRAEENEAR